MVKVVLLSEFLCTPGVSKENGLVQAIERVEIKESEERQYRAEWKT